MSHDIITYSSAIVWKRAAKCSNCGTEFENRKNYSPFVLPCAHTICQKCLINVRPVKCNTCKETFSMPRGLHYETKFERNYFVMGESYFRYWIQAKDYLKSKVAEKSYDDGEKDDADDGEKMLKCIECAADTKGYCVKCDRAPYCQKCFDSIHGKGIILKQHSLKTENDLFNIDDCAIHGVRARDFYCVTCHQPICGDCRNAQHSEHQTKTLTVQNKGNEERIKRIMRQLNKMDTQIDDTQKVRNNFRFSELW